MIGRVKTKAFEAAAPKVAILNTQSNCHQQNSVQSNSNDNPLSLYRTMC